MVSQHSSTPPLPFQNTQSVPPVISVRWSAFDFDTEIDRGVAHSGTMDASYGKSKWLFDGIFSHSPLVACVRCMRRADPKVHAIRRSNFIPHIQLVNRLFFFAATRRDSCLELECARPRKAIEFLDANENRELRAEREKKGQPFHHISANAHYFVLRPMHNYTDTRRLRLANESDRFAENIRS